MDSSKESREHQQFQEKKMQVSQPKDRLDMEIEELILLMVDMSQRRHVKRMNIYISKENIQNTGRGQTPKKYCRSKASGALQHKIWKPLELKMTKTNLHNKMGDLL